MPAIAIPKGILLVVKPFIVSAIAKIVAQRVVCDQVESNITGQYLPMLDTWQGEAADAFRAEVQSRLLPEINMVKEALGSMRTKCEIGQSTIESTDRKCVSYSDHLQGIYANVIKW